MKRLAKVILVCAPLFGGCAVTPDDADPVVAQQIATLEDLLAVATAAYEADPTPVNKAAMDEAAAQLDAYSDRIVRERLGPVTGTVAAYAPWAAPFLPLLLGFLPLTRKRGRKHAANAVKALAPFVKNPQTGRREFNMDFGEAIDSIQKMLGMKHSSEASAAAAGDAPPPQPPATT